MKRAMCVAGFVVLAALFGSAVQAQDSPFFGTWKLNTAKSKFQPGPGPKSLTRTIGKEGNAVKYSFEGVSGDGTAFAYSFATYYDGTNAAITGKGAPGGADAVNLKRVNPHKIDGTLWKGGKEVGKVVAEVSNDGKTATVKMKGKTVDGKEYSSESEYEKQ